MLKKLSSVAFALAIIPGIVLFTHYGREYVSIPTARIWFMAAVGTGLILNLFNYNQSKCNPVFTFVYWLGSIVLFAGLVFQLMQWPYDKIILIAGLGITGISFFMTPELVEGKKDEGLLDDLDRKK